MDDGRWREVAKCQAAVIARRQLVELGVSQSVVRHHLRMERWAERTPTVLTTTTGPLSREQQLWVAVLHAGPGALIGGLTAAEVHGLRHWPRDEVTVLVDDELAFNPVPGVRFFRTRRDLQDWRAPVDLPVCRIEPAILLFAGYQRSLRTALGAVAAAVQQRLTMADRLAAQLETMKPLRRARDLRSLLGDLAGGVQSVAELDVRRACRGYGVRPPARQRSRLDRSGKRRFTDCEWDLPGGRTLVLEVDGGFHLEVMQYSADMRRQRRLTTDRRVVVRCSAYEIRHEPGEVMQDLIALGAPRTPGRVFPGASRYDA